MKPAALQHSPPLEYCVDFTKEGNVSNFCEQALGKRGDSVKPCGLNKTVEFKTQHIIICLGVLSYHQDSVVV